jgi:hypothetical protein
MTAAAQQHRDYVGRARTAACRYAPASTDASRTPSMGDHSAWAAAGGRRAEIDGDARVRIVIECTQHRYQPLGGPTATQHSWHSVVLLGRVVRRSPP